VFNITSDTRASHFRDKSIHTAERNGTDNQTRVNPLSTWHLNARWMYVW